MKTVIAVVALCLMLAQPSFAFDQDVENAWRICQQHRGPVVGGRGPAVGFAEGWESCAKVETLWQAEHSADRENSEKDQINKLLERGK